MKTNHSSLLLGFSCIALLILVIGCATPTQTMYYRPEPKPSPPPAPPAPPAPPNAPTATANVQDLSRVTNDPAPEWWPRLSPDGSTLLYHTIDQTKSKSERVSIVSISIGKPGKKLMAGPHAWMPTWYPDGRQFLYVYLKAAKPILVRSPIAGVGMTFVTPNAMGDYDNQPDVSPTGDRIAFHTKMGDSYSICTVNADGSNFTLYVEGFSPRWSPDGNRIAFDKPVGDNSQVFLLDLGSGQVTQLTSGNYGNHFPVWSPDGNWLVFVSNRDGQNHLYAMMVDGTSVTQLTKGGTRESFPEWGKDGYVYFVSDAGSPSATNDDAFQWAMLFSDIWRLKPVLSE